MQDGKEDDEEDVFYSLADDDELEVQSTIDSFPKQRLSCFAHTLKLVINDGLKETRNLCGAPSKPSRISTLLRRSTVFK